MKLIKTLVMKKLVQVGIRFIVPIRKLSLENGVMDTRTVFLKARLQAIVLKKFN
jgi:hypothetical protein